MLVAIQCLGVMPCFSRLAVSNDNPFSESLFNTVKGRPNFPDEPFASRQAARSRVARFTARYSGEPSAAP